MGADMTMNEKDEAACKEAWAKYTGSKAWPKSIEFAAGFAAAIECRDKLAEPVALEVGNLEYMGNSVSFIYQKMRAYKDGIGKVWQALRDNGIHPDGQTHAADAIRRALAHPTQPVEPVAVDHSGLIKRIDAAIKRVTQGRGLMSIPADPRSDVDLVLSECKALLQGENPPFWATDFHPAQPVQPDFSDAYQGAREDAEIWKKRALEAEELNRKFIAEINGQTFMGEPAQPVQPARAQSWELDEEACKFLADMITADPDQITRVGFHLGYAKDDDGNLVHGFSVYEAEYPEEGVHTLVETKPPPAAAINEQLLEALNDFSNYVRTEQSSTDGQVQYSNTQINRLAFKARAAIAAAEAEKAKGGAA